MFDEEGYFFFLDRKKDYLRCRGENISSSEMEATFLMHPDIADVAVHAVPSDLTEDDLKVTAMLRPGASVTPRELFDWAVDRVRLRPSSLYRVSRFLADESNWKGFEVRAS